MAIGAIKASDNRVFEGTTLNKIAEVHEAQERDVAAMTHDEQALAISRMLGDQAPEGSTLVYAGEVYDTQRRYAEALTYFQQALAVRREVGLTRVFIFAGTPSVIATLWSVDDQATGLLMEQFYTLLWGGASKAAALQQTQQAVRKFFPHPYYWGAFVLTGDERDVTAQPGSRRPSR
jgi:tetratricopeptide (TPR) repeat protein